MAAFIPDAGKRYVARNGMITTPIEIDAYGGGYPIAAELNDRFEIWTRDGFIFGPHRPDPRDLVAEYGEAPALIAEAA